MREIKDQAHLKNLTYLILGVIKMREQSCSPLVDELHKILERINKDNNLKDVVCLFNLEQIYGKYFGHVRGKS